MKSGLIPKIIKVDEQKRLTRIRNKKYYTCNSYFNNIFNKNGHILCVSMYIRAYGVICIQVSHAEKVSTSSRVNDDY